tara:strand:+ start:514 stop:891 length:378 start_codon:yes stop_codon:yes gene_type:complete
MRDTTIASNTDQNFTMDTRGKRPSFFHSPETDAVMTALLETMSQLWATRNQVQILEKLLIQKSVITQDELDIFDFNITEKARDNQAMQDFFADAFRAMGASVQSIDSRNQEVDEAQKSTTKRDQI